MSTEGSPIRQKEGYWGYLKRVVMLGFLPIPVLVFLGINPIVFPFFPIGAGVLGTLWYVSQSPVQSAPVEETQQAEPTEPSEDEKVP